MIKCVIFDLGGVYFSDGTSLAIKKISEVFGISLESVKEVLDGDLGSQYRMGKITADEFWMQATNQWGINVKNVEIAPIWIEAYEPIPGTVEIVDLLIAARYEVLFLSDNVGERIDYLERKYQFMEKFKDGIFSHLAGTRKPDPAIYEMVLEKTGHPAEQCVYIDDKSEMLEPARKLGMKTIAFLSPRQLEEDLRSLGVEFFQMS